MNKKHEGKLHDLIFESDVQAGEAKVPLDYAFNLLKVFLDRHGYEDYNAPHDNLEVETIAAARHLLNEARKAVDVLSSTIQSMADILRADSTEKAARNGNSDTATN